MNFSISKGEELHFKVFATAKRFHTVRLWEEDEDWDCDCDEHQPCEHIFAAALAFAEGKIQKQSEKSRRGSDVGPNLIL